MHKLTTKENVFLTENIIRSLAQNRIKTVCDFLQEDAEKLSVISKLSLPDLLDIRTRILLRYSAPLVHGSSLLIEYVTDRKHIPTNIECIDDVLEGGIPVGYITELCGLAGSGKTQFCLHLAVNCAKDLICSVLYIDTKGDFSAIKLQKTLDMCGYNHEQMAAIMFKIKIVRVWNSEEAIQALNKVKEGIIENLGLLIIDSLPCLMFQHIGDDNKIGLTLLNELVNNIRFISKNLQVGVICVNIQTRWLDQDISDIDDDDESCIASKETNTEKRNRCLGKYWRHIPSVLLVLENNESNTHVSESSRQIQVQIFKSRIPKQSYQCAFKLSDLGMSSV